MSPKDKAIELVNKYIGIDETMSYDTARSCAIVAVNEFIDRLKLLYGSSWEVGYWQNVRDYILKM